jgi:hypothetical protein
LRFLLVVTVTVVVAVAVAVAVVVACCSMSSNASSSALSEASPSTIHDDMRVIAFDPYLAPFSQQLKDRYTRLQLLKREIDYKEEVRCGVYGSVVWHNCAVGSHTMLQCTKQGPEEFGDFS